MENLEKLVHNYFYYDYVQIRDFHSLQMKNLQTMEDVIRYAKNNPIEKKEFASEDAYKNALFNFITNAKISIDSMQQYDEINNAFGKVVFNLKFYSTASKDIANIDNKINHSLEKLNKFIISNSKSTEETINNTKNLLTELKQYSENNSDKNLIVEKVNNHIKENINGYTAYEKQQIKDNLLTFAGGLSAKNSINFKMQEIDNNFNKYCVKTR